MKLTINIDDLTVGDIEDFDTACGIDFFTLVKADGKLDIPLRALAPLIWITERRTNPAFSLEDARRVKVTEIEPPDPPAAAGGGGRSTAGSRRSQSSTGTRRKSSAR